MEDISDETLAHEAYKAWQNYELTVLGRSFMDWSDLSVDEKAKWKYVTEHIRLCVEFDTIFPLPWIG